MRRTPLTYGGFFTLFVYTDIIEHQVVGDHFVPLLRCVHISGEDKDVVTTNYNKVHYIRVSKSYISDIEVKTDQNLSVPFKYGKVVAKRHFRPVTRTRWNFLWTILNGCAATEKNIVNPHLKTAAKNVVREVVSNVMTTANGDRNQGGSGMLVMSRRSVKRPPGVRREPKAKKNST